MPDLEGYLERIKHYLPDLAIRSASLNTDGLVNVIVFVNDEPRPASGDAWVFRFPKDATGREAQARERRVLDLVRGRVDLPVPEFEAFEDQLVRYRKLPGEALSRSSILRQLEEVQDRLAGQLGRFLCQLHSIPQSEAKACGIPPAGSVRSREDWLVLYDRVEEKLFPLLWAHHKHWVREHFRPVLEGSLSLDYSPVLVHGDLGSYHILFDPQRHQLAGVIDFGTSGPGDPADDFANLIYYLGESFLHKMDGEYPEIGRLIDRARFWAGTLELQWALAGLETGDLSWLTIHIGSARDMQPVGARWV